MGSLFSTAPMPMVPSQSNQQDMSRANIERKAEYMAGGVSGVRSYNTTNQSTSLKNADSAENVYKIEDEIGTYLDNKRGKVGTITTSWQGLLNKDENKPKRKTLLGE